MPARASGGGGGEGVLDSKFPGSLENFTLFPLFPINKFPCFMSNVYVKVLFNSTKIPTHSY